jgi:hypothetical protein
MEEEFFQGKRSDSEMLLKEEFWWDSQRLSRKPET